MYNVNINFSFKSEIRLLSILAENQNPPRIIQRNYLVDEFIVPDIESIESRWEAALFKDDIVLDVLIDDEVGVNLDGPSPFLDGAHENEEFVVIP